VNSRAAELPQLIETETALAELTRDLGRQARVSVDTESNSLHAYRERVCLIQFSTSEQDYVVDPLALGNLESLGAIFSEPRIEKIFHASEYDLICLRRDYGFSFSNIFDTMQAGRILGRKQAGLDRLLAEKFGITISKRFQKADWGVRPLSRDLLLYAVLDTHYLIALRDVLKTELQQRGLWELAQEDFRIACNPGGAKPKPEAPSWSRFSMRRDLSARELTVLRELLACREDIAQRLDRPLFKVLDDEQLIEIARAGPSTLEELAETGLSSRQMEYWGPEVLDAVRRGMENNLVARKRPPAPDAAYLRRLDKLKEWRKKAAAAMEVESDVVLPRSLLLALVEDPSGDVTTIMQPSPWRLQQFGDQISQVLQAADRRGQSLGPSS
jgi:ribonuclease D